MPTKENLVAGALLDFVGYLAVIKNFPFSDILPIAIEFAILAD
jgi:hypothetical protein